VASGGHPLPCTGRGAHDAWRRRSMKATASRASILAARPAALDRRDDPAPHGRLLSNGRYTVLLTGSGAGTSWFGAHRLTGWRGDRTEDGDGTFVFLRDRDDGRFWSAGAQPVAGHPDALAVQTAPGTVTLTRREHGIASSLEVCVSPDADLEVRRIELRNASDRRRSIEVTTCAEVVLHQAAAHAAHPAFQKLFVETEHVAGIGLVARRRPRSAGDTHPCLLHALLAPGEAEHESDRARFLGRGRTLAAPRALTSPEPLSGTVGSVLDPLLALRRTVVLEPGATISLHAVLLVAPTRDEVIALAERNLDLASLDRSFARAAEHALETAHAAGFDPETAEALDDVAVAMLYDDPALRASGDIVRAARGGTAALAGIGVARDATSVVVQIAREDDVALLADVLRARDLWRAHGLDVAVIACARDAASATLARTLPGIAASAVIDAGVLAPDTRAALLASARWVLPPASATPPLVAPRASIAQPARATADAADVPEDGAATGLRTGLGGFTADGGGYTFTLANGERPPMPWVNVLANERFGCLVSESGAGNTWSRNSRENRLTPWRNDPVSDPHAEALYVRDDDAGVFWSPQPGPVPSGAPCTISHELGASRWQQTSHDLLQEVVTFVPPTDPVRVQRVRLTDTSGRARRLSVFVHQELVLGVLAADGARFVVSERDATTGTLLAWNRLNEEFADGVAFASAAASGATRVALHGSCDRGAFLGRDGTAASPAALRSAAALDGAAGTGLDPCFALQLEIELAPGGTAECVFVLGEVADVNDARALALRHRDPAYAARALEATRAFWRDLTSAVRVRTPSPEIDVLLNGWLLYQTLACRIWGRTAFYQSGGAFGFRDQLQDSSAFVLPRPEIARAQLLLHAAHQYPEGDVLHWWHPPLARGIRTRFADDLCWLPWLTARYVRATGDTAVLDERCGFVTARALEPGEDEAYLAPGRSDEESDLYDHCCRALDRGLTTGAHGLPLMGTGDWNDGMNRVGREGRGESVWMAFFLHRILADFVPLCERRGDAERVRRYRDYQAGLRAALEAHAWDGAWYRRAYYDDGSTLGSAQDAECRIDALAQAWAVLSGAVPAERATQAMDAAERLLVDRDGGLIRLLTPPFDRDPHDPGYIKGYLPGIRENGGQYTHAALWMVQATAELGRRARAVELLEMLLPPRHAADARGVATYQVEPYVVAADVYGVAPHVGRGGWTWYTGSSGWAYRVALETILGVTIEHGDTLCVRPRVPDAWPGYHVELTLDGGQTRCTLEVVNPDGIAERVVAASLDDTPAPVADGVARIPLARDAATHRARVVLGA